MELSEIQVADFEKKQTEQKHCPVCFVWKKRK